MVSRLMHWIVSTRQCSTPNSCCSGPGSPGEMRPFSAGVPWWLQGAEPPLNTHWADSTDETWTFVLLSIWEWGAVCFSDITSWLTLTPLPLLWRDWRDWFILQECQPAALWMGKMYLLLCIQANSLFLSTACESSSLLPPFFLGAKFISDLFSLLNLYNSLFSKDIFSGSILPWRK